MLILFKKIASASWLGRVYKTDKVLFAILGSFALLTIGFNLTRLQTTPFFLWNMYSGPLPATDTNVYYQIWYNKDHLINLRHTFNEPEKTYLYIPLNEYVAARSNGGVDPSRSYLVDWAGRHRRFSGLTAGLCNTPADLDQFPTWLGNYISGVTGETVRSVCVLRKKVRFDGTGMPVELSSDTVLYTH
jgi:hypothetical protein